ncbi:MAG: tetratricopeptide repeat protein [Spirochaetaceae bacterium]|nr:MAG: tetratricopeptide repeat protein [Spirochaetaceae bacterium]
MSLFRKKNSAAPDSLLQDLWHTDFRWLEKRRFPTEIAKDFSARTRRRRLELQIHKQSCFAWVLEPYQYGDFMIRAKLHVGEENGHSSAGFVFRYNNEDNFYYFLLSNSDRFRFDVVFNKNPMHLIEWTPLPDSVDDTTELRIIVRDNTFSFFLSDEWLAEVSDDTLRTGFVGFAGQNYEEGDEAIFFLDSITIESRPVQVEQEYLRWTRYVPISPQSRITLARTYVDMAKHSEAVAQLKAAVKHVPDSAEALSLLSRSYTQLKAYPESLSCLDRLLELEPDNDQLRLEKADVLFLNGDFLTCRDYIESILPRYPEDAQLRNLLGRCEYNLGNWENAAKRYREAVDLDSENAVYRVNLARCQERAGDLENAVKTYFEAARQLFHQELYEELSLVLARLGKLVPPDSDQAYELKSFEGKMLYNEGKKHQAENLFAEVIGSGYSDSGVHYLLALTMIEKQERAAAEIHLAKATEIDPDYPLYWFRLAENRFLLGEDPWEALDKAYTLDAKDTWINNLRGQVLLKEERYPEALPCFQRALESAPESADIYRNCAECLLRLNRGEEALQLLTAGIEKADGTKEQLASMYNQRGNCLVELDRFGLAVVDYEKALKLIPDSRDYMQNCAACCIELDMIMRAEELLNRLLEEQESASLYNLTGNLSVVTGEFERARLAYLQGLKLEEDNREIKLNLLSLYIDTNKVEEAGSLLAEVEAWENPPERYSHLRGRFRDRFETLVECSTCTRQWWVPKQLPPQPAFTIRGEPPGEAPAGRCEQCDRVYCIACASDWVEDGRLVCPKCNNRLRLNDDALKYLVLQYVGEQ